MVLLLAASLCVVETDHAGHGDLCALLLVIALGASLVVSLVPAAGSGGSAPAVLPLVPVRATPAPV
jgi:hypothetical protein